MMHKKTMLCRRRNDGTIGYTTEPSYDRWYVHAILAPKNLEQGVRAGLTSKADEVISLTKASFFEQWELGSTISAAEKRAIIDQCFNSVLPVAESLEAQPESTDEHPHHVSHLMWMILEQVIHMQLVDGTIVVDRWNGYFLDGADRGFEQIASTLYFDLSIRHSADKNDCVARAKEVIDWALAPTAESWARLWSHLKRPLSEIRFWFRRGADSVSGFRAEFAVSAHDGRTISVVSAPIPWKAWSIELVTEFVVPIPSGTAIFSNDLRVFFPDDEMFFDKTPDVLPKDYVAHPSAADGLPPITINSAIGRHAAMLLAAKGGRGEFFSGDCGGEWVRHVPTGAILCLERGQMDAWDGKEIEPQPDLEQLGEIESDLWWSHFADLQLVASRRPYQLWSNKERKRCRIDDISYAEWCKEHRCFEVDLKGAKALKVTTNGANDVLWTHPSSGKVLRAMAVLQPVS